MRKVLPDEESKIIQLYVKGFGIKSLKKIFHHDYYTIRNILVDNLVSVRTNQEQKFLELSKVDGAIFFNEINTEEKAYWLGMLYADGNIFNKGTHTYRTSLGLFVRDKSHVERFAFHFKKTVKVFKNGKSQIARCEINNIVLYKSLVTKGFVDNKSLKNITQVFDHIPDNLMHHFIRGIFDGDGSIFKVLRRNQMTVGFHVSFVGSLFTLERIRSLVSHRVSVSNPKLIPKRGANTFEIVWNRIDEIKKIYNWMYNDTTLYLERKYRIFEEVV
jgi:hypothetical protein